MERARVPREGPQRQRVGERGGRLELEQVLGDQVHGQLELQVIRGLVRFVGRPEGISCEVRVLLGGCCCRVGCCRRGGGGGRGSSGHRHPVLAAVHGAGHGGGDAAVMMAAAPLEDKQVLDEVSEGGQVLCVAGEQVHAQVLVQQPYAPTRQQCAACRYLWVDAWVQQGLWT